MGDDKARKTENLFVRLTPEEYDALIRVAADEDRPGSAMARQIIRKALLNQGVTARPRAGHGGGKGP